MVPDSSTSDILLQTQTRLYISSRSTRTHYTDYNMWSHCPVVSTLVPTPSSLRHPAVYWSCPRSRRVCLCCIWIPTAIWDMDASAFACTHWCYSWVGCFPNWHQAITSPFNSWVEWKSLTLRAHTRTHTHTHVYMWWPCTVCPGSSSPSPPLPWDAATERWMTNCKLWILTRWTTWQEMGNGQ